MITAQDTIARAAIMHGPELRQVLAELEKQLAHDAAASRSQEVREAVESMLASCRLAMARISAHDWDSLVAQPFDGGMIALHASCRVLGLDHLERQALESSMW